MKNGGRVIVNSIKWSSFTEIGVKLITPITTMILARLLTPEAFGVLAICAMIISFAEIIADAGFGKYIVQADFHDEETLNKYASVAFWSHLIVATTLWITILLLADYIAEGLGVRGKENVIIVASTQLILMSAISTQLALLRRKFAFKKTFVARISVVLTTFCVTIPFALVLKSYWALIIGNLCGCFVNVIVLFMMSKWKPNCFFSIRILKDMFGFSFWSLAEGLAHWFIFWFDVFIVSRYFSTYYVGLYKNSTSIMFSAIGVITASMSPVLLSVLSRLRSDRNSYREVYMSITRLFMYGVLPVCTCVFFCKDLVTNILLGGQWLEASKIVGFWAIMLGISLFVYSFPAEIYKSMGKPQWLFFYQLSYIVFLMPICILSARFGFWEFVYTRVGCVLIQLLLYFIFLRLFLGWKISWVLNRYIKPIIAEFVFIALILCIYVLLNCWFTVGFVLPIVVACCLYILLCSTLFKQDIIHSFHIINKKEIL